MGQATATAWFIRSEVEIRQLSLEGPLNHVAEAAYEAYAMVVRAEQQTLAVPSWEELPPRMQEGWREAVKEACRRYQAEE